MATGRMINKSISTDAKLAMTLADLDGDTRATGVAIWTWTIAHLNCWGVYHANPHVLLGHVVPMLPWATIEQVEACVTAFARAEMLVIWEEKDQAWLWYPRFRANQPALRVDRESKSGLSLPRPPIDKVLERGVDPVVAGYADTELDDGVLEMVNDARRSSRRVVRMVAGKVPDNDRQTTGEIPDSDRQSAGNIPEEDRAISISSSIGIDRSRSSGRSGGGASHTTAQRVLLAFDSAWPGEATDSYVQDLISDYPDLDLVGCIHDAKAYEMQNPRRAKKRHTMFLRNWCKIERRKLSQEGGGNGDANRDQQAGEESKAEYESRVVAEMERRRSGD